MKTVSQIGALFDIDGTLLPPPSLEWRFIAYLLARDQIPTRNAWRWLAQATKTFALHLRAAILANKQYLHGLRESLVADWDQSLDAAHCRPLRFEPAGLDRLDWHLSQQHRVFLVSGTLEPLARVTQQRLGRALDVRATRLKISAGHWTGDIAGRHMSGGAKADALLDLAKKYEIALDRSYAYGNSIKDAPMLESVGHPRAVNPSWRLADFALSRGWEICSWPQPPVLTDANGNAEPSLAPRNAR
jgi:HAD superfamily hydrolase (TIGR01490 family)